MGSKNVVVKMAQDMCRQLVAEQTRARLMLSFDCAIIAAHEVFKMGPVRSARFNKAYNEAMNWLCDLYVTDDREHKDEKLVYAKAKRDQLIKSIVGEELFIPFDVAYGDAYMDELHRIRSAADKANGK